MATILTNISVLFIVSFFISPIRIQSLHNNSAIELSSNLSEELTYDSYNSSVGSGYNQSIRLKWFLIIIYAVSMIVCFLPFVAVALYLNGARILWVSTKHFKSVSKHPSLR